MLHRRALRHGVLSCMSVLLLGEVLPLLLLMLLLDWIMLLSPVYDACGR